MDPQSRRAVAYIAARLTIRNRSSNSLFDFQQNMQFNFSLNSKITDTNISVFDFTTASYITGRQSGDVGTPIGLHLGLVYAATGGQIEVVIEQGQSDQGDFIFRGKDKNNAVPFHGTISPDGKVSFYDAGAGRYFSLKF